MKHINTYKLFESKFDSENLLIIKDLFQEYIDEFDLDNLDNWGDNNSIGNFYDYVEWDKDESMRKKNLDFKIQIISNTFKMDDSEAKTLISNFDRLKLEIKKFKSILESYGFSVNLDTNDHILISMAHDLKWRCITIEIK